MYWVDYELNVIYRSNLDGGKWQKLVTLGLDQPAGIALLLSQEPR
jgi:hypothetical protein